MSDDTKVPNQPPAVDPGAVRLAIVGESPGVEEVSWATCASGHGFALRHWSNRQLVTRDRCSLCGTQSFTPTPRPFSGESGRLLDAILSDSGLPRERVFIGNCSRTPLSEGEKDLEHCRGGLAMLAVELEEYKPTLVLCLGGLSLAAFGPPRFEPSPTKWRGSRFTGTLEGVDYECMAALHPAAILREPSQLALLRFDIARAVAEAAHPSPPIQRVIDAPTSADDVCDLLGDIWNEGKPVGYDLEGDHKCVTVCSFATSATRALSIPLRAMDYSRLWSTADEERIVGAVGRILSETAVPKVCHNAAFETFVHRWLYSHCLRSPEDSMIAFNVMWPELDKNLSVAASILTMTPYWGETTDWRNQADRDTYNCLIRGTRVITSYGTLPIERIVKDRLPVYVLTMNERTGVREWKPIVGWHRTQIKRAQEWWQVKLDRGEGRGIVCTPDHEILTTEGRVPAARLTVSHRVFVPVPATHEDYLGGLLGAVLGDSFLGRRNVNGLPQVNGVQLGKSLVAEKTRLFGGTMRLRPNYTTPWSKTPQLYSDWYLPGTPAMSRLLDAIKPNGAAALTSDLLRRITPLGWALWFMDDGCKQKSKVSSDSIHLAVCRYDIPSRQAVLAFLRERFGALSLQNPGILQFGPRASRKFCSFIGRFVIPEYRYKLVGAPPNYEATSLPSGVGWDWLPVALSAPFTKRFVGTGYKKVRYCLSVADNNNFFTTGGLVSNCIDSCVCLEAWQRLMAEFTPAQRAYYETQRDLLEPCGAMSFEGMAFDASARDALVARIQQEVYEAQGDLDQLAGIPRPTFADVRDVVAMKIRHAKCIDWPDLLTYAKPSMRENL